MDDHYHYQSHSPNTIGNGICAPNIFRTLSFTDTIHDFEIFRAIKLATSLVFETVDERDSRRELSYETADRRHRSAATNRYV